MCQNSSITRSVNFPPTGKTFSLPASIVLFPDHYCFNQYESLLSVPHQINRMKGCFICRVVWWWKKKTLRSSQDLNLTLEQMVVINRHSSNLLTSICVYLWNKDWTGQRTTKWSQQSHNRRNSFDYDVACCIYPCFYLERLIDKPGGGDTGWIN